MINFNSLTIYLKVNYIFMCFEFVIAVVGIVGNVLLISVLARKKLRKHSYSFYCTVKSVLDIILLLYAIRNWCTFVMDANLDLVARFLCIFNKFMPNFAGFYEVGVLLMISIDQYFAVIYPNRFAWMKKKWFQVGIIILIGIYTGGINMMLPPNTDIIQSQVGNLTISALQWWLTNTNNFFDLI